MLVRYLVVKMASGKVEDTMMEKDRAEAAAKARAASDKNIYVVAKVYMMVTPRTELDIETCDE